MNKLLPVRPMLTGSENVVTVTKAEERSRIGAHENTCYKLALEENLTSQSDERKGTVASLHV